MAGKSTTKREREWLARLADFPEDVVARTAYADWLAKRGAARKADVMKLSAELLPLCKRQYSGRRLTNKEYARMRAIQDRLYDLSQKVDSRWIARVDPSLAIPLELPELGRKAAEVVVELLGEAGWAYSGSGTIFSVCEDARFGRRDRDAVLVEVRLAGDLLDEMFSICSSERKLDEQLRERLDQIGTWWDLQDESTAVIYPASYPGFMIGLG
jgi:uncharacterized protein (TIGR02996 family)